jgi:RimJ/RimL family protein N-acetyltransferase
VPYGKSHVATYHEWMKDKVIFCQFLSMNVNSANTLQEIQEATASEPLSLEEEYAMQTNWRADYDKLTFIACLPVSSHHNTVKAGDADSPERMVGDVNLFLSLAEEDEEGCIGELELMIAPPTFRRQGYGRATILAFLHYISSHLASILEEYRKGARKQKMKLLQLRVKIGSKNEKSINLFQSIGFIKVEEGLNYFGEFELVLEGFLGEKRIRALEEKWAIEGYEELAYEESDAAIHN